MTTIPPNLHRVPTGLSAALSARNINRTSASLLQVQMQLSSGRRIERPSDDVASASLITVLDQRIDFREQEVRNLQHARSLVDYSDSVLGNANDIVLQAREIASAMVGSTVDAETRANEAEVIDGLIRQMLSFANSQFNDIYLFGGRQTAVAPYEELLGGFRFQGSTEELQAAVRMPGVTAMTVTADRAFGAVSARVEGSVELEPPLTSETSLLDLNGARGLGVAVGILDISVNGSNAIRLDLTGSDTAQDVADRIEDAIRQYEADNGASILGAGGVSLDANAGALEFELNLPATLEFTDVGEGTTAADLGLTAQTFTAINNQGDDLDPRLTPMTDLSGIVGAMGDFMIENAGSAVLIEASTATTVEELINLVEAADIGARMEIAEDGKHLNLVNELAGGDMSVYDVPGSDFIESLGLRSFSRDTLLADFNQGMGVEIVAGAINPDTGEEDPTLDTDFRVTLSDGSTFDVNLAGAVTVGDVIDITQAAAPAGFSISLRDDGNGFLLEDTTGGSGPFSVEPLNRSYAAEDLGLVFSTDSATFASDDRAKVAVDGVLTHLLSLRDALLNDDTRGITFAGGLLDSDIDRFAQARAVLGERSRMMDMMITREEEFEIMDQSLRSQMQDVDFIEASVRFSTLQAQLEAALAVSARSSSLSLMDFLR